MDDMTEINFLTIHEALKEMREGRLDPQDLSEACFRQIETLNPTLNAFITVCIDAKVRNESAENPHYQPEIATAEKHRLAMTLENIKCPHLLMFADAPTKATDFGYNKFPILFGFIGKGGTF